MRDYPTFKAITLLDSAAILPKPVQIDREFHVSAEFSKPSVRSPGHHHARSLAHSCRDALARGGLSPRQEVGRHMNGDLLSRFHCRPRTVASGARQSGKSNLLILPAQRASLVASDLTKAPRRPDWDAAAGHRPCSRARSQRV